MSLSVFTAACLTCLLVPVVTFHSGHRSEFRGSDCPGMPEEGQPTVTGRPF